MEGWNYFVNILNFNLHFLLNFGPKSKQERIIIKRRVNFAIFFSVRAMKISSRSEE